jgi:hypothetical protein
VSIAEFLAWLIGGGGIGVLVSRLFTWLGEHWLWFATLRDDLKRVFVFVGTFVVAAAIGGLAILVQAWFGEPLPASAQDWVAQLFVIGSAAIEAGQISHKIGEVRAGE